VFMSAQSLESKPKYHLSFPHQLGWRPWFLPLLPSFRDEEICSECAHLTVAKPRCCLFTCSPPLPSTRHPTPPLSNIRFRSTGPFDQILFITPPVPSSCFLLHNRSRRKPCGSLSPAMAVCQFSLCRRWVPPYASSFLSFTMSNLFGLTLLFRESLPPMQIPLSRLARSSLPLDRKCLPGFCFL